MKKRKAYQSDLIESLRNTGVAEEYLRIIQNIWFLSLSSGSPQCSSPMVQRLRADPQEGRSHPSAGLV